MNRRSLMLGGLIASAAGVLGVKATSPVFAPVVEKHHGIRITNQGSTTTSAANTLTFGVMSGYQYQQLVNPSWYRVAPEDRIITAKLDPWAAVTPDDLQDPIIVTYKVDPNA